MGELENWLLSGGVSLALSLDALEESGVNAQDCIESLSMGLLGFNVNM